MDQEPVRYANAKVLLVGDSGVGKTGLFKRLVLDNWVPSESTIGAWATQMKLPVDSGDGVEHEIWLWDFGGQADLRLMHQLYMDETALVVFVFDVQREDLFETLSRWDRELTRAARRPFTKLLVAGRVDAGSLRVRRNQIEAYVKERGYAQFLETSAKTNLGCQQLRQAILEGIRWEDIPWHSSSLLFNRLRKEIIRLKDDGHVLMRFNELREMLQLRLADQVAIVSDEELRAVVALLVAAGVVWELGFGSWVLLQPSLIGLYAQALVHTLRADQYERGIILEERLLTGNLLYVSSFQRLASADERFVLLALHQTLVERGFCLREHTDKGVVLIFPTYYRRERTELVEHPAVLVSYRFNGFLDDIYATLVVRLHYTQSFVQDHLWRYAADFKTLTGKRLGVKLIRLVEGAGELQVYFDPDIPMEEKIIFSKYIHEHLLQSARDVVRLRHYICPYCGTPLANPEVVMKRREQGKNDIICFSCERRVPLWDQLEELFASMVAEQRVRELQDLSARELDSESKQRALVGEVISTVALAGQICREFSVSDYGIDMEIEFKDEQGQATGNKVYLQLKADSDLHRRRDGTEIFTLKDQRLAQYWMGQPFPVLLVVRSATGEVRWMDVRDRLKRATDNGKKAVRNVVFEGEPFDVMSVHRWREPMIRQSRDLLVSQAMGDLRVEVRRSSLEKLTTSWVDENTQSLLFHRGVNDVDEGIRCLSLKKLAILWPDDKTRDLLITVAEKDASPEVRVACCEELSRQWWKDLHVRRWLRARMEIETEDATQQRLLRTIESASSQVSDFWTVKLSGTESAEQEVQTFPGYPAFRVSRFRLCNIGPFQDTQEVELVRGVNIFLGDNSMGKTTILKCLALAAVGPAAANEVEDNPSAYLRKGTQRGTIEVLFEIVPDPDTSMTELGCFCVGLQITAGASRFTPMPDSEMTLRQPISAVERLSNSAEYLGTLRTDWYSQFGFVSAYGVVRTFGESRFAIQTELKKRENEWVLSLFKPEAALVNPEVFTKLIRGDTSNIEEGPLDGLSAEVVDTLQTSLRHLFPEVNTFFKQGDNDLQLNGTPFRFGEMSDGYRSLFALMGHLLRCSLKVCDWEDNPTQIDGIVLIDEIDLHLHPAWQVHIVQDFCKAFPNIQLIASTHSPLVVGSLKQQNILIMRRIDDGNITVDRPDFDPQGLGVAGILTSIFDLSSTIDQPTLDKINRRLVLHGNRVNWTEAEQQEYSRLTDELARLGFNREFSDPYFEQFATAMAKRHEATLAKLTPSDRLELDAYADQLLADILKEDDK